MAKIKQITDQPKPKLYDDLDVKKLADAVDGFEQERVGVRLQPPFDLYCQSVGILRFDAWGSRILQDAPGYHTQCQMWAEVESKRRKVDHAKRKELEELQKAETAHLAEALSI